MKRHLPTPSKTTHKAQIAGGSSSVLALLVALFAGGDLDWRSIAGAAAAGAVTGVLTWWKRNHPAPSEAGAVTVTLVDVCLLILTVVAVLWWFGVRP